MNLQLLVCRKRSPRLLGGSSKLVAWAPRFFEPVSERCRARCFRGLQSEIRQGTFAAVVGIGGADLGLVLRILVLLVVG